MKSRKAIEKKLVQVRFRHLKKALRTGLSRKPENCLYNAKLGKGAKPDSPRVGVCMFKVSEGSGPRGVCDECFGGQNRAADCGDFEPRQDVADIRKDFENFLSTASKGEIAFHYPDLAALLWTLGDHPALDDTLPDDGVLLEELQVAENSVAAEERAELTLVEAPSLWERLVATIRGWFSG